MRQVDSSLGRMKTKGRVFIVIDIEEQDVPPARYEPDCGGKPQQAEQGKDGAAQFWHLPQKLKTLV